MAGDYLSGNNYTSNFDEDRSTSVNVPLIIFVLVLPLLCAMLAILFSVAFYFLYYKPRRQKQRERLLQALADDSEKLRMSAQAQSVLPPKPLNRSVREVNPSMLSVY
uniref:Uncharacterized protein n=1 Tax=Globodera rostochiensis TaxID=31243 RepID=A0A914I270_GLORO